MNFCSIESRLDLSDYLLEWMELFFGIDIGEGWYKGIGVICLVKFVLVLNLDVVSIGSKNGLWSNN